MMHLQKKKKTSDFLVIVISTSHNNHYGLKSNVTLEWVIKLLKHPLLHITGITLTNTTDKPKLVTVGNQL